MSKYFDLDAKLKKFHGGTIDYYMRKGKSYVQEYADGLPHTIKIVKTEFYGSSQFQTRPHTTFTLLIDGRRELGGRLDVGTTTTITEFEWYGTEDGQPPKENGNHES